MKHLHAKIVAFDSSTKSLQCPLPTIVSCKMDIVPVLAYNDESCNNLLGLLSQLEIALLD
jgi:hypothetical protein